MPRIIGVCTSEGSFTWMPVFFAYKGFILLAGLFLAFETRKVKIKSLNDSRFIAMSVYGAVIVSIALTPIGFLLQKRGGREKGGEERREGERRRGGEGERRRGGRKEEGREG